MMAAAPPANPYPGLRAFEPGENDLFFGRERETDELRRRLRTTRLLAVIGSSGSGKSSLVRSGLIPSLHGGFMSGAGTSWRVAITRPGEDPIGNLADALDKPEVLGATDARADTRRTVLEVTLRDSSLGLAEAVRHAGLPVADNVLVVVDQFEELFRFRRSRAQRQTDDDAAAFVKLLLEAARGSDPPIYVVLTMRSEFIGECMEFGGLPEAINAGQYLIPRMSRDALRAAITGPAAVRGVTIAPRLLARLLNEVGNDLDRLPVLQHALMRTWDAWARDHAPGESLDVRHYEAIGTMKEALSRHAEEAWAELDGERECAIAQRLFRTLTETTEDQRGVRRPTAFGVLSTVCGAGEAELARVIDRFRAPGRAFLQPGAGVPLTPASIVDISHESLMRLWPRLAGWVQEEARSTEIYRRLVRSAAQHAAGEAGLWRPPELAIGLRWLRENRPGAEWAGDRAAFDQAMRFLQRSRRVHTLKMGLAAVGLAMVVALAISWFAWKAQQQRAEAERERQQNVELQAEVNRLTAAKAAASQVQQTQSEQVQALRARQTALTEQVATLQQARSKLEANVAALREGNRALEADLERLAAEQTRLQEQSDALDQVFARLGGEARDLASRLRQLEPVPPILQAQSAALRAQLDALRERNWALTQLVRETEPCASERSTAAPEPAPPPRPAPAAPAPPPPPPPTPRIFPDARSPDELRRRIDELARQLAQLREEKSRLQDEAAWIEKENALLDQQREALQQESTRLQQEREALEARQLALRQAAERAEVDRKALAAQIASKQARNETKRAEVEAARKLHRELEERTVGETTAIGEARRAADRLRADNQRLAGVMTAHVDRLLQAARSTEQPPDVAALLAVKAYRWAPYDADDAAQPAVYNTLWMALSRIDSAAARALLAPGDPAAGKLATTRSRVLVEALCRRVSRPLTEAEWVRYLPTGACYTPVGARVCER